MTIPDNLAGLSYSDPRGIEVGDLTDTEAVAQEQEVDGSIFGNLHTYFANAHVAFAYLIFILLYTLRSRDGRLCARIWCSLRALYCGMDDGAGLRFCGDLLPSYPYC